MTHNEALTVVLDNLAEMGPLNGTISREVSNFVDRVASSLLSVDLRTGYACYVLANDPQRDTMRPWLRNQTRIVAGDALQVLGSLDRTTYRIREESLGFDMRYRPTIALSSMDLQDLQAGRARLPVGQWVKLPGCSFRSRWVGITRGGTVNAVHYGLKQSSRTWTTRCWIASATRAA